MNKLLFIPVFVFLFLIITCQDNPGEPDQNDSLWPVAQPETQNMSPQLLDSALTRAQSSGFIDGLLVIRNGYIVAERYYNGHDRLQPHNVMSVSKSFLSAITGIALDQGYLDDWDVKMLDYFPEYIYSDIDPRKYDITLRHLLTMRMGIRGEAEDNYQVYHQLYTSENWIKSTIEEPLVSDPGERMRYNTFQTHLLSAIITKATSQSTLDYANEQLFIPLQIDVDAWERDPQGYYFGGNGRYLRLLRIIYCRR